MPTVTDDDDDEALDDASVRGISSARVMLITDGLVEH